MDAAENSVVVVVRDVRDLNCNSADGSRNTWAEPGTISGVESARVGELIAPVGSLIDVSDYTQGVVVRAISFLLQEKAGAVMGDNIKVKSTYVSRGRGSGVVKKLERVLVRELVAEVRDVIRQIVVVSGAYANSFEGYLDPQILLTEELKVGFGSRRVRNLRDHNIGIIESGMQAAMERIFLCSTNKRMVERMLGRVVSGRVS